MLGGKLSFVEDVASLSPNPNTAKLAVREDYIVENAV
jgi:hypothetical protein